MEIVTSGYYKLEVWGAQGGNHPNRYTNNRKAEQERQKNEKLFRTLGMTAGLAIVIILM